MFARAMALKSETKFWRVTQNFIALTVQASQNSGIMFDFLDDSNHSTIDQKQARGLPTPTAGNSRLLNQDLIYYSPWRISFQGLETDATRP
jgi:hypothetical protein